MEADELIKTISDPNAWQAKGVSLRRAGDAVWGLVVPSVVRAAKAYKDGNDAELQAATEEVVGYLQSAQLLYGMALEAALKAHILRNNPKDVSLLVTTDGSGAVQKVSVEQFGTPLREGHDLLRLAEKAGVFTRGDGAILKTDSDFRALRNILGHLSEAISWRSRYPAPTRSGSTFEPDTGVPVTVLGQNLRDFLDPVLDHYLRPNEERDE